MLLLIFVDFVLSLNQIFEDIKLYNIIVDISSNKNKNVKVVFTKNK